MSKRKLDDGGNLILDRREGQAILIGRGVRVTVLDIGVGTVRLSVEAPKHIAVSRDDITVEQHMNFQRWREKRSGVTEGP